MSQSTTTDGRSFIYDIKSIIEKRRVEQDEIYSTLGWLSLQSRRKYQVCLQVFKCLNNLAPVYLLNEFRFSSDIHNYNTRNKDLIRVPRAKTTKYQSSFPCNGANCGIICRLTTGTKVHFPLLNLR